MINHTDIYFNDKMILNLFFREEEEGGVVMEREISLIMREICFVFG